MVKFYPWWISWRSLGLKFATFYRLQMFHETQHMNQNGMSWMSRNIFQMIYFFMRFHQYIRIYKKTGSNPIISIV